MQDAIIVHMLPPTSTKGLRLKASHGDRAIVVHWDYLATFAQNASMAAAKLIEEKGLCGRYAGASATIGGSPYILFVRTDLIPDQSIDFEVSPR